MSELHAVSFRGALYSPAMSRMRRPAAPLVLVAGLVALGCASAPANPTGAIHDFTMRDRVARVNAGQTLEEARVILGDDPVRKPGHPDDPYPSPHRTQLFTTPAGVSVRIDVYVVATRPAEGCPDVHFEDEPIAYLDGVVAGKDWAWVERHWRAWGGSLEALRDAQDRHRCPYPVPETKPES
jgi:hypothetical protein